MRPLIAVALFAVLSSSSVRAEVWDEHAYPDVGFAVRFPSDPQVEAGSYVTLGGVTVPATIYSAKQDNSVYTMTVADFSNSSADEANAIADAVRLVDKTGDIKLNVNARINRQFGRELSVADDDGSRSTMGIFFFNHHLYELRAKVAPPNPESGSAEALIFQQSLRFMAGNNGGQFGPGFGPGGRGGRGPGGFGGRRFRGPPPPPSPSPAL